MKKYGFFAAALAVLLLAGGAWAADKVWDKGTPTVYVGFGAGGGTDTAVRPLIALMEKHLGETINVANMPGAAGALAAEDVQGKPHDGYSLFATGSGCFGGYTLNNTSPKGVPWNWWGFHHIQGPAALVVNPEKSGINTVEDAIKALKEGKANVGVSSLGAGIHAFVEAFAKAAGVGTKINYVTSGGDGKTCVAVMAGEVEIGSISFSAGVDYARSGKLKVLFLNRREPLKLTDSITLPPITDFGPQYASIPDLAETWPVMVPRDAPKAVVDKLREAFLWACEQPEMKDFAEKMGYQVIARHGEEADKVLDYQYAAYAWVVYDAGLAETDKSPADFGIPRAEEWDWNKEKAKYGYK
ncbi:MAG: tripartite tricarboxylate transporter substrate binding protein [Synergistaceae bacterium]|jgi:tripartite-type tricarboxylate transporter receptor subunit TctC|nr:tripartite tricarboxylate transporter substrate binding protein [Synergistaceae bacterium]